MNGNGSLLVGAGLAVIVGLSSVGCSVVSGGKSDGEKNPQSGTLSYDVPNDPKLSPTAPASPAVPGPIVRTYSTGGQSERIEFTQDSFNAFNTFLARAASAGIKTDVYAQRMFADKADALDGTYDGKVALGGVNELVTLALPKITKVRDTYIDFNLK